ncbi:MAG: RelA/SpoT family protein, partial [Rubricoccaceae bacterium]|nr:RelA/SpoT family protein [Rubricoccaceae bacterium]
RLHNMRTLESLPRDKRLKKATETLDLFAPLAHRFGLHEVKTELEDLSLKYIDSAAYQDIAEGLKAKRRQRQKFIDRFIGPIEEELQKAGFDFEIYGRPKSIYSIYRKMKRQDAKLDEIYDLFAIRIILNSEGKKGREDCWRVYSILTDLYQPLPERFRDFVSVPKSNGYQSLHTTVLGPEGKPVEIQIRTAEMHEIAERGVAAHYKYKEDPGASGDGASALDMSNREARLDAMYAWVRDLLENPRADDAGEFVKEFQLNLYDEEIYVFTPNGDLLTLPRGATPVDFAFQIHTQVGFHCIGAKVNGKMVPLSRELTPGDQVEILTSNKQTPNPDWMKFVVTHMARSRIRHWINDKRRKAVDRGRETLDRKLKKAKLDLDEQSINRASSKLKFPTSQQLFYEIGAGLYDADDFVKYIIGRNSNTPDPDADTETDGETARLEIEQFAADARELGRTALIIDGEKHSEMAVRYAPCCNPIPGDDVFGFISKTGAVKIHRVTCKNAPNLLLDKAERIISVEWSRQKDVQFVAALRIVGEDRVGIVSDITTVISKNLKTNIRSITVESEDSLFEGTLVIFVSDLKQLRRIMQRLSRLDGIYGVYRLEE